MGVECGGREVGERDGVAGRFNLVYLTGNFDFFFFFNLEINQRGNLTAESRVVVVQSPSHVRLCDPMDCSTPGSRVASSKSQNPQAEDQGSGYTRIIKAVWTSLTVVSQFKLCTLDSVNSILPPTNSYLPP